MQEFLSPCLFECVIACCGAAVWCYTFGSMKWEAFIETREVLGRQNTVKSYFHSNQLTLSQNNAAGAAAWQLEHHPHHKQGGKKKRSAYTVIASFTTAICLTVGLPARPTYLCLNLSYQFFSHSPCLLVIAHHPVIERKGACSVNKLTNLYDLISLKHVSANILSHKWFIHLWAWWQNSHPFVHVQCTFYDHAAFYIKIQLLECRIAEMKTAKTSPQSTGLNHMNDDKHPGCQRNRHWGLTHSSHFSLGASNACSSPDWLSIKCFCDIECSCNG